MSDKITKVCVLGCGNVGVAIAADLSIKGYDVTIVKTSQSREGVFEKIQRNGNRVLKKENGEYQKAIISKMTHDIEEVSTADVVFLTIQSTYHEQVIKNIGPYLNKGQIVVVICSYLSSLYFDKYCKDNMPVIVETTGPYLEGRIEEQDTEGEIVFRVGCRLTRSPLSIYPDSIAVKTMSRICSLYKGFKQEYTPIESALLNPNLVLHTVGSIMSIPRIEHSKGNFCMYREAYARDNKATLRIMMQLDAEKMAVLREMGLKPVDVFEAGGFLGDPMESFYAYSESSDRAISPTSVQSRYITEDVSQGLVLLESIAKYVGVEVPITSSLISIAGAALNYDFRKEGRTIERLGGIGKICKASI